MLRDVLPAVLAACEAIVDGCQLLVMMSMDGRDGRDDTYGGLGLDPMLKSER
jgi:hypothetical protein